LRQGQVIGYLGTTGNAVENASHLRFAIGHPREALVEGEGETIRGCFGSSRRRR
jgi:murein DD-endopeptidase MepM/ murein hydrolase activator NlpD